MQTDMASDNASKAETLVDPDAYHPMFCSSDADITLSSKDNVRFRVHSFILKTSSAWFRSMLSLPQSTPPSQDEIIYMDEDSGVLQPLFSMACGLPVSPTDDYDLIDSLLQAAEKYDMPGPLSIIRMMVMTPPLLGQPFRLYAAACRFGWEEEARFASAETLAYNLHDPELRTDLQRLSTTALLDLLALHRARRDGLRQRLNDPPFVTGGIATCTSCDDLIDYHTWRELKYKIALELDARPLGDTIEYGLNEWPESKACWRAQCPNPRCDRVLYDKGETSRVIRECINKLPKSI